jgi:hypothetical protein
MKMVGFRLPPVFVRDLAMQERSVRPCSITAIGPANRPRNMDRTINSPTLSSYRLFRRFASMAINGGLAGRWRETKESPGLPQLASAGGASSSFPTSILS